MRSVGEVGLSERRTESEYREIIGSMLEEVERLTRLVDTLLTLARADAGRTRLQFESVNLDELVYDVVAHLSALTEEKKQTVQVSSESGLRASVDRAIVRQAVVNLLDNAIKYSPAGSEIRIAVLRQNQFAVIEIIDTAQESILRTLNGFSTAFIAETTHDPVKSAGWDSDYRLHNGLRRSTAVRSKWKASTVAAARFGCN